MATKKLQPVILVTWGGLRTRFISLVTLLVACLIMLAVYLTGNNGWLFEDPPRATLSSDPSEPSTCNMFAGKWVFDNASYPLYSEQQCSFMSDQLACEKFGRKDLDYQHWRWQPDHCDLPRFNATALLERLRGKRLVYVGDSLNRGQWVSMVCLVESAIPSPFKSMHTNGSLSVFKAIEYNATVEFYWAPLLVESNSDDPMNHRLPDRIVRIQAIEKHARYWNDADILVFDTYLWWKRPKMKILWGSFGDPDGIYKEVAMLRSYEMALKTWSDWLEIHVNHTKTQLYFVTMSPTHQSAAEWGVMGEDQNCYNETRPIMRKEYWGRGSNVNMMRLVGESMQSLRDRGVDVKLLNVTQLSEYRKEGHPSIYRRQWDPLTEEQLLNPTSYSDCIHWCLPGVPDVWNELLYAHIFS